MGKRGPRAFVAFFWRHVSCSLEPGACWNWHGGFMRRYGRMGHKLAHRVAWSIVNGSIPDGMCICHKCDNPSCVRPDHLFLGTVADNNHDRDRKGRQVAPRGDYHPARLHPEMLARGEEHGNAKMTARAVVEIRALYAAGNTMRSIAKRFNIDRSQVGNIVHRKQWRHVA